MPVATRSLKNKPGRPKGARNFKWKRRIIQVTPVIPTWSRKATEHADVALECGHIIQIPKYKLAYAKDGLLTCDFCMNGEDNE